MSSPKASDVRMLRSGPVRLQPPIGAQAERAWAATWLCHRSDVVRYVSHLLAGDVHAAEDVAQETALRLWQHPEVLLADEPLTGWLRTVARNIVIDRARRRQSRPAEVALGPGFDAPDKDRLSLVEDASSTRAMLAELPPQHRAAIIEVYMRDRPVAEVAAELGIPTGTVKSRCFNAIRRLRASSTTPPVCA